MDVALRNPVRIPLGVLVLAYAAGTPGLGIDTRTGASATLGAVYTVAVLIPLLAIGASWKWPRAATRVAILGGAFAVVLPTLDLMGTLVGPPPGLMVALDVAILTLGLVVIWSCSRRS